MSEANKTQITRFLKARLGAVDYLPDPRDYQVALLTPEMLETIPDEEYALLDWVSQDTGRSQGNIGSCVGWCNSFAYEIAKNIKRTSEDAGQFLFDMSAGYMYQKSRERAGIPLPSEGSTNFGAMKALLKDGITSEEYCKTDIVKPFDFEPKDGAYLVAQSNKIDAYYRVGTTPTAMKAAMLGLTHDPGYRMPDGTMGLCPMVTAFLVYKNTWSDGYVDGFVKIPVPGDELLGGHSSLIIGWIVLNGKTWWINYGSWGTSIGTGIENSLGTMVEGIFLIEEGYPFKDAWVFRMGDVEPELEKSLWCKLGDFFNAMGKCKEVK